MKNIALLSSLLLLVPLTSALGQGTFFFDQQSSGDETPPNFGSGATMQNVPTPWGQSFTPNLSSISFIRLKFDDGNTTDGLGATIYLNLRSGSITGPLIGITTPVTMANGFAGTANFFFPSDLQLSPGDMYFFEPIVQSGGPWNIDAQPFNYPGGYAVYGGQPLPGTDLWFREGILVPEPSAIALGLLGLAAISLSRTFPATRRSPSPPALTSTGSQ